MTVVRFFVLAIFVILPTVSVGNDVLKRTNDSEGKALLLKMVNAMKTLNYQGTVVFLRNGKLETMKYFHAAKNEAEQERLLSLNSPLREITRNASHVSCHFKTKQQTIVDYRPFESSFLLDIPKNLEQLDASYNFDVVGDENIAMLPTFVVAVQPKDNFRYTRKIWIEKSHLLPLKVVVYDFSGIPLEQLIFTEIEIKDSLPFANEDAFNKVPGDEKQIPVTNSPATAAFEIRELPKNFQEVFFTRSAVHNSDQLVDHMILSDGFSYVSVYMENKNANMQSGPQTIGAVNSYSKSIGDFELTVMGEVPAATVKVIAESIKLRNLTN